MIPLIRQNIGEPLMAAKEKVDFTKVAKDLVLAISTLQEYFNAAEEFVRVNYKCTEYRDKSIKILATINQLIEIKRQKGQQS